MTDLDTADKELVELKKIPFKLKEQAETKEKSENHFEQEKQETNSSETVADKVPEETEAASPVEDEEIKPDIQEGIEETTPETELAQVKETLVDKKKKSTPTPSRMARKQIQVVDLNDEFVDDEADTVEEQTPLTKPVVIKKPKPYRLNRKLEASIRNSTLPDKVEVNENSEETASE